jgi:phage terminase large subunit
VEPFAADPKWAGPYYGADWGFANDPTAIVRCWVDDTARALYVDHEAYGVGVEIDRTPELIRQLPESDKHVIRADSARPETISYMQRHGFPRLVGASKGAGSVEDGVEHLRSYSAIIIHPRCKHVADEARLWSYKTDRLTGDIKPQLEDKHNHCMDALRYALEPLIRRRSDPSVRLL